MTQLAKRPRTGKKTKSAEVGLRLHFQRAGPDSSGGWGQADVISVASRWRRGAHQPPPPPPRERGGIKKLGPTTRHSGIGAHFGIRVIRLPRFRGFPWYSPRIAWILVAFEPRFFASYFAGRIKLGNPSSVETRGGKPLKTKIILGVI